MPPGGESERLAFWVKALCLSHAWRISHAKRAHTPGVSSGSLAKGAMFGICPLGEFYCLTPFEKGKLKW